MMMGEEEVADLSQNLVDRVDRVGVDPVQNLIEDLLQSLKGHQQVKANR